MRLIALMAAWLHFSGCSGEDFRAAATGGASSDAAEDDAGARERDDKQGASHPEGDDGTGGGTARPPTGGLVGNGGASGDPAPANVAGKYTVQVTNGEDGCDFENWAEGETATDVHMLFEQDGNRMSGRVESLHAFALAFLVGSAEFHGSVVGSGVEASITGTLGHTREACKFTVNAHLSARVSESDNTIAGSVRYKPNRSDDPACAELMGCNNEQKFSGARPPSP